MEFSGYDAVHEMQTLLSELDAAERELAAQRNAVDASAQLISATEQEIKAARENAARAQAEVRRRENELSTLRSSFAPTLVRREEIQTVLGQRRRALEEAQQRRREGEEQFACLAVAVDDLTRTSQESRARRAALALMIEQLTAELRELDARLGTEDAERARLDEERAAFGSALETWREAEAKLSKDVVQRQHGADALLEATTSAQRELDALEATLVEVRGLTLECETLAHEGVGRLQEHRDALAKARRAFNDAQTRANELRTSRRAALDAHLGKLRAAEAQMTHARAEALRTLAWLSAAQPLSDRLSPPAHALKSRPISVAQRLARDSEMFAQLAAKRQAARKNTNR
ncbi:MAG TPA: hypothetical protein VGD50_04275 [Candidatus Baltobacteraceae bacterium]